MTDDEKTDEYENLYCPECRIEQLCYKLKNGKYRCSVCETEFDYYESEEACDNDTEEEPPFF